MEAFGPQTVIVTFILKFFPFYFLFDFITKEHMSLSKSLPFSHPWFPCHWRRLTGAPCSVSQQSHSVLNAQFIEVSRKIKWEVELKSFSFSSSF